MKDIGQVLAAKLYDLDKHQVEQFVVLLQIGHDVGRGAAHKFATVWPSAPNRRGTMVRYGCLAIKTASRMLSLPSKWL